ncbi:MAG: hypothetical protein LBR83_09275 [Clostridiales bacterium]|nr:hypothetical protein [Clostridiales bacterium]
MLTGFGLAALLAGLLIRKKAAR